MMVAPGAIEAVRGILDAGDFYLEKHGRIYRAALALHDRHEPVDAITLPAELEQRGDLDKVGGRVHIHELARLVPPAANAAHYARIVQEMATLRGFIRAGGEIAQLGWEREGTVGDLTAKAERLVRELVDRRARGTERAPLKIVTARQFLDMEDAHAPALLGTDEQAILTVGGFLLMAGEGGASKTTLSLDALVHMAAGAPWLALPVARPVRVLLIENEGPRPKFRQKLEEKLEAWEGDDPTGNLLVSSEPWGRFSFADVGLRNELRAVCRELTIDLVFADPVDSLGIQGVGAPDETRAFMDHLKLLGLFDPAEPLSFWLLHHFNKSQAKSVLAQLSGAWGGHPDAVLGISMAGDRRTKLRWAKTRWADPEGELLGDEEWLLGWDGAKGFDRIHVTEKATVSDDELLRRISDFVLEQNAKGTQPSKSAVRKAVKGDSVRIDALLAEHFHNHGTQHRQAWSMQPNEQQAIATEPAGEWKVASS